MRPSTIRATDGVPSKMLTSPCRPSRGPSAYRCGSSASVARSILAETSPESTSRWAPTQRTAHGAAAVVSALLSRTGRGRLEAEAGKRRAAVAAHEEIDEGLGERRLLRPGHDGDGIHDWTIGVRGGAE